jgi:hypothetical protein
MLLAFARLASLNLAEGSGVPSVIGWSLVVFVFVIGGFYAITWVRRWMKDDEVSAIGLGFTLGDLRDLHRRGEMTDEEYEKAKAKIVRGTQAEAERIKPGSEAARDTAEMIRARAEARRAAAQNPPQDPSPSDKPPL